MYVFLHLHVHFVGLGQAVHRYTSMGGGDHPQGRLSFTSVRLTLNKSNKKQNNYLQNKLFGSVGHFVPYCGKTKWPTNHELQVCCLDQPPEGCF